MNRLHALESKHRDEFRRKGFLIAKNFCQISSKMSQELSAILARSASLDSTTFINGAKYVISGQGACCRVEWIPFEAPSVRSLFTGNAITAAASFLTGVDKFDLIICQYNFRRPSDNVTYDWHRDRQHDKGTFRDTRSSDEAILISIATTDIPLSCAPMSVLPYSHLEKNRNITVPVSEIDVSTLTMSAGDALFMHPALLHSSGENCSKLVRGLLLGLLVPSNSYSRSKAPFSTITAERCHEAF